MSSVLATANAFVSEYNRVINNALSPISQPQWRGLIYVFLILYGALAAPQLPMTVLKMFDWVPFRIAVITLIMMIATRDFGMALLMAMAFYASVNTLNGKKPFEKLTI